MRVIVCGSRDWTDKATVWRELDRLLAKEAHPNKCGNLIIVHGKCPTGADYFAELWCQRNGVAPVHFHADFDKLGPSAGPRRDKEMAKAGADLCLGFWDGRWRVRRGKKCKPGTLTTVEYALQFGIPIRIVPPRVAGRAGA